MSIAAEYKRIYEKEMILPGRGVIFIYSPLTDKYHFKPFSHNTKPDCIEQLGSLMRKNLTFYCYGEEEVVNNYNKNLLNDLETNARYAYINRLPKRPAKSDGLPGEILLDLLIQIYEKDLYKLAVRPLLRQQDNIEIKGYDLTYFSIINDEVTLWLGQAKLGDEHYCKSDIHNDLLKKFKDEYLGKQVFFICDKQIGVTEESKKITDVVNKINHATITQDDSTRAKKLLECFKDNNISINIPCLLAYDKNDVYCDVRCIFNKIEIEMSNMRNYFIRNNYLFEGFMPNIIFYIFPISDIVKLRSSNGGFYDGLC